MQQTKSDRKAMMDVFIEAERLLADCIERHGGSKKPKKENWQAMAKLKYPLLPTVRDSLPPVLTNKKRSHHEFF